MGYFPAAYWYDFLALIHRHRDLVQVVSYNDLPWAAEDEPAARYPREFARWCGARDPERIMLLIQHDVDGLPERTQAFVEHELALHVPANVMVFNRRTRRRQGPGGGAAEYTDYTLNDACLRDAMRGNFAIGYHCNAYEQADFDMAEGLRIFRADIAALRRRFAIDFYSPHGGARDTQGRSNACLEPPFLRELGVRLATGWDLNFFGVYSDGGLSAQSRNLDLRDFVRSWRRGHRYWMLIHPQYYAPTWRPHPLLAQQAWYAALLQAYAGDTAADWWLTAADHLQGQRHARPAPVSFALWQQRLSSGARRSALLCGALKLGRRWWRPTRRDRT